MILKQSSPSDCKLEKIHFEDISRRTLAQCFDKLIKLFGDVGVGHVFDGVHHGDGEGVAGCGRV